MNPDLGGYKTGNESWFGGRKAGNVVVEDPESWQWILIASFKAPNQDIASFPAPSNQFIVSFAGPKSGLITTYQAVASIREHCHFQSPI